MVSAAISATLAGLALIPLILLGTTLWLLCQKETPLLHTEPPVCAPCLPKIYGFQVTESLGDARGISYHTINKPAQPRLFSRFVGAVAGKIRPQRVVNYHLNLERLLHEESPLAHKEEGGLYSC